MLNSARGALLPEAQRAALVPISCFVRLSFHLSSKLFEHLKKPNHSCRYQNTRRCWTKP